MSLWVETGLHMEEAEISFQNSGGISSCKGPYFYTSPNFCTYCVEGSSGAAPKNRKCILNPYSKSHQNQHHQSQKLLTQFTIVQTERAHMWAHLTVKAGMKFSGFAVLNELRVTISHMFSYGILQALESLQCLLYTKLSWFSQKIFRHSTL